MLIALNAPCGDTFISNVPFNPPVPLEMERLLSEEDTVTAPSTAVPPVGVSDLTRPVLGGAIPFALKFNKIPFIVAVAVSAVVVLGSVLFVAVRTRSPEARLPDASVRDTTEVAGSIPKTTADASPVFLIPFAVVTL
jgi:hypothetical protein